MQKTKKDKKKIKLFFIYLFLSFFVFFFIFFDLCLKLLCNIIHDVVRVRSGQFLGLYNLDEKLPTFSVDLLRPVHPAWPWTSYL